MKGVLHTERKKVRELKAAITQNRLLTALRSEKAEKIERNVILNSIFWEISAKWTYLLHLI